jgi:hypothetical protein
MGCGFQNRIFLTNEEENPHSNHHAENVSRGSTDGILCPIRLHFPMIGDPFSEIMNTAALDKKISDEMAAILTVF